MKPGGAPSSPRLARRGGVGLRRQGYALMELLLFIVITTGLAVSVMRSVKPQTTSVNNSAQVIIEGLENLMQAHQLMRPRCLPLVYSSSTADQPLANWCWLFVPDPVTGLAPHPTLSFQPNSSADFRPTWLLSNFWGRNNGRDTGQGDYQINTGVAINIVDRNEFLTLTVLLNRIQILDMGFDQCSSLLNVLINRVTTQGFPLQLISRDSRLGGTMAVASMTTPNRSKLISRYLPAKNIVEPTNFNLTRVISKYCSDPWSGSFDSYNNLTIYLGLGSV